MVCHPPAASFEVALALLETQRAISQGSRITVRPAWLDLDPSVHSWVPNWIRSTEYFRDRFGAGIVSLMEVK